ncbi:MAG: glycosyltransferase, partial [Planctomycetota bacterium]
EVDHRKRHAGKSKYGKIRFLTGLLDIWTLLFLTRFPFRPSHFFGAIGLLFAAIGFLINGYIAYLRLAYGTIQFRYPLLALGILLLLVGLQFIFTGFLSELLAFYLHENRKTYSVREIVDD